MDNQIKLCATCKVEKPLSEFAPTKQQLKFGVKSVCRDCDREYKRQWVLKNPVRQREQISGWKASNREKVRAWNRDYAARMRKERPEQAKLYEARARFKREYGITLDERDAMIAGQNGLCSICHRKPGVKGLCVDHCHASGKVREMICSACNMAVGMAEEVPDWLESIAAYLRRHDEDPDPPPSRSHEALWREHLR
jgi:hypothetical protein